MKKAPEKKPVIQANEHYEAALARDEKPKIADVEAQFGLKKNQLVNYRANQGKLQKAEKARLEASNDPLGAAIENISTFIKLGQQPDLECSIASVVKEVAATAGSSQVTAKRIREILEMDDSGEARDWSLKVIDAMIDRDMVAKGVLVRDAEDVKRILAGEAPRRNVVSQPPAEARLITVPIENVVVCPLNPRRKIDQALIEEMADSILEHDIVQPPVARPGKYADTYEVVFGQRRLLGKRLALEKAKAAKQPRPATIQLLVREMDDRTVLEEAWVENLQRVDVGAREEVEGFQAMLDLRDDQGRPIYTLSSLATKLGKSKGFISQRLKLKNVPEEMWQAHEAGVIGLRQMELVGKLPTDALRKKAAGMVLRPKYREEGEPLTVVETTKMLKDEFMVSLRGMPWDQADADLLPVKLDKKTGERVSGGACADCPHRTGSNPDLQDALDYKGREGKQGLDHNLCMLPSCCTAKKDAFWQRAKREGSENGTQVLTPEESKKIFYTWGGGGVQPHSGWVSLAEKPGYQETGHYAGEDTLPTWGEMIKKVDPTDLALARNESTGDVHQLLKRERAIELAEAALGKKGKDSPFANRPGAPQDLNDDEGEGGGDDSAGSGSSGPSEWQIKREREKRLQEALNKKLREAVDLQKTPSEAVITELVLGTLWEDLNYTGSGLMALLSARGLPEFDDENGDDEEAARAYLDGVVRPEIERAPYAWAALALFEIYDQFNRADEPMQTEGLFRALNLDREAILAAPDEEEPAEDAA